MAVMCTPSNGLRLWAVSGAPPGASLGRGPGTASLTQLPGSTGTLTENRMTVVAGWFAGQFYPQPPALDEMPKELQSAIEINSSMNSKVDWALLLLWNALHVHIEWFHIAEC